MSGTRNQILDVLSEIERPGQYATSGDIETCLMGLEIANVGMIGFPILAEQAQAIIQQCEQAPYGKGEDTVLDREVRSTWQLDAKHIKIHNSHWETLLSGVVKQVTSQLGLGDSQVNYELYKLLMYEAGDFFTVHRDTEKIDNMFATLIIVLPSAYSGGELIVRHQGDEMAFSFGQENQLYQMSYASFYADCQHEVKPIKSGYRCCLVYNLALKNVKKQPLAPDNRDLVDKLSGLLHNQLAEKDVDKIAILLEHQYSQASLSFANLKNGDWIKADVLIAAAQQADCELYLAIVTQWESGYPEDDGYYHDEDDLEMAEIFESSLSIDHWFSVEDEPLDLGEMELDEGEIISKYKLTESSPDEKDVQEATGNAGASMEQWYRQAALVIWSRQNRFIHIAVAGEEHSIPHLKKMVDGQLKQATTQDDCRALAQTIIQRWQLQRYTNQSDKAGLLLTMMQVLITLDDIQLHQQFISQVLTQLYISRLDNKIVALCQQHGWKTFANELVLVAKHAPNVLSFSTLLFELSVTDTDHPQQQREICQTLAPVLVTGLKSYDVELNESKNYYTCDRYTIEERVTGLVALFKVLHVLEETTLLEELVRYCGDTLKYYNLYTVLIPSITQLAETAKQLDWHDFPALGRLHAHCVAQLEAATAKPVVKPKDWRQDIKLNCEGPDCEELQAFLYNPNEQVHRFRVKKERRQYLHQIIDGHGCDITHVTERKGSPQTLVCTKNHASYEKRRKQWETDKDLLEMLSQIQVNQ